MNETPKYYTVLFNAVTDALDQLEQRNYGTAAGILTQGQLQAEKEFLAAGGTETK